ncbi:galactoside-binding lectin domain-containing protein [Ditylenchus destructor]|nr:galactoside-binding lectin domain-containing protein [Ditylenchus destructor]
MASILRKLFGFRHKRITKKDSITGRNNTFPVPYLSKLEGNQLQPGQSLIVRGLIIGTHEFVINLTSGPRVELDEETDALDDRLLCLRATIADKRPRIHLNACVNGEWGREGTIKHKWHHGDEFDIRVRCHEDEFEVFLDHKLVARFAHYVPLSNITHIYINGDIELYSVSWEGRTYTVPYAADIPGNFYPGRKLYVSGQAKKRAKQFKLELHSGQNVALSINPRFPSKKVICNTKTDKEWGKEVRLTGQDDFPFRRKRTFDLLVYCEDNKFVIYVDDCLLGSYEHVINPRSIEKITIDGDLILHGVHLK